MLTGKLPFHANTAWEWAAQHMTQPPIPIESLAEGMRAPEAMRSAIRRALAKEPADRFQTVGEYSDAFSGQAMGAHQGATGKGPAVAPRTEVGAPLDVGSAFGAPLMGGGGVPPAMPRPGSGPREYASTSEAGNVTFPTPAGIPQPPPPMDAGGSGRKTLLAAAGLIGVASIVAIVFAIRGSGGASPGSIRCR